MNAVSLHGGTSRSDLHVEILVFDFLLLPQWLLCAIPCSMGLAFSCIEVGYGMFRGPLM